MPEAPYAPNEIQRIAAVQKTRMIGTPAEERFDKITRLARRLFDVPMAAIDLVGEKVAWIKSAQGFGAVTALRKDSYCHYTVLEDKVCLVASDARNDPRFFDNEFSSHWVFYAGAPLSFEGQNVGVLCIGDNKPRNLSQEDRDGLFDLAAMAEQELSICALSEAQIRLSQRNEELEKKSRIDPLTRGWSREAIFEIAKEELLNTRENLSTAIMMIDIDHFKTINDTYGHPAGDEVLKIVSERIRNVIRTMDAVGRYGGDELLTVLTNVNKNEIARIGNNICKEISNSPIIYYNHQIKTTCSIGYALQEKHDSIDSLIKRADLALYRTKLNGRNGVSG